MYHTKRIAIVTFFLILFLTVKAQTNQWPKTLLWRITGNGLEKPSFLYGTIHLEDRRLFYFGDSLYRCLEQADGYAIEVNLHEFIDSMMSQVFQGKEQEILNDDEKLSATGNNKKKTFLIDSLFKNAKKGDKESRKKLEQLRRQQVNNITQPDMPTFMDAYLYGIARRQGKWLGSIEDVQDQLGIVDEIGHRLDTTDFLKPNAKLRFTLEEMIKNYIAKDLDGIDKYDKTGLTDDMQEKLFLKRNIKMAKRMDSLSHIRSIFFAIGAGHLPGDSGVINLLKRKGFTVEPVFATRNIAPEKYAATLDEVPWQTIEEQNKLYRIDMPEKPGDYNLMGEIVKMKVDIDITTMTYYMIGQTIMNGSLNKMDDLFKEMAKKMGDPSPINVQHIKKDSVDGIEGIINSSYGYYRIQFWQYSNAMYMLMAGNGKKDAVFSTDINRYFKSFTINKNLVRSQQSEWTLFNLPEKAFSVSLPGQPKRNKAYEKNAEKSNWNFAVYDFIDMSSGLYYMVQVRDIAPGYFLDGDSSYFEQFKKGIGKLFKDTIENKMIVYKGFPALRLDGHSKERDIFYKTLTVNRGNRVYMLTVIGSNTVLDNEGIRVFFDSFTMTEYPHTDLKKQSAKDAGFYTTAANPITEIVKDSSDASAYITDRVRKRYISFNPDEVISYQVYKDAISSYDWFANDSSLYDYHTGDLRFYSDSVISYKHISNGKLKGIERVFYMRGNNNRKRIRQFLNGDTLYTLISFIPSQYINESRHNSFFEDFRVTIENTSTTVFENKAGKLLDGLLSEDSIVSQETHSALRAAKFSKKDLPLLYKAVLSAYPDDSLNYGGIKSMLVHEINRLADSTTVDFVKTNYNGLTGKDEKTKYWLLDILAEKKTRYSYDALKQLLIANPPRSDASYFALSYRFADSLELCQGLYPDILKLSSNPYLWETVVDNAEKMLDSNRVSLSMILPYKESFLFNADTVLKSLRKQNDKDAGYSYSDLVKLVGRFNDERSNQLLQQYVKLKNAELKQQSVIALLKNNQVVNPEEINKLAADKSKRNDFYDELKEMHKEKFFPQKFFTQRYFAESKIYSYAYDDYEPSAIEYIGERIRVFDGSRQRFLLFKIVYEGEEGEEGESTLAIAGPYNLHNSKDVKTNGKGTGLYYEKPFDPASVDNFFESFISDREKSLKEHPEWYVSSE